MVVNRQSSGTSRLKVERRPDERLILDDLPSRPPDPKSSVIKVEFSEPLLAMCEPDKAAWLGRPA
jgi:hypothetical protein